MNLDHLRRSLYRQACARRPQSTRKPLREKQRVSQGGNWSDEDTARLRELYENRPDLTIDQIAREFPGRTRASADNRIKRLRREGSVKSGRPAGKRLQP
jgi:hypothetical protein